jgi:hypothetical protein
LRRRDFYYFHIASGLLLLVKIHFFIALYPPVIIVLLVILHRKKRLISAVRLWMGGLGILLVAGGWWYIRSFLIFHNILGYIAYETTEASFLKNVGSWLFFWSPRVFRRFWGEWGWVDYRYPLFIYYIFLLLCAVPALFWLNYLRLSRKKAKNAHPAPQKSVSVERLRQYMILGSPLLIYLLEMILIAGMTSAESVDQGRIWLPFMLSIAVYLGGFFEHVYPKAEAAPSPKILKLSWIALAYLVLFIALNIYMIYLTYQRYYGGTG